MDSCSKCSRDSIIFLAYVKKHLCQKHFIELFEKRARKTIRTDCPIKKGMRVAVGLSGGKDSTVMLNILADLQKDLPFELVAVTIDEGIKGYRNNSLEAAKIEAKKRNVEHHIFTFKAQTGHTLDEIMEIKKKETPCSYCGVIRRHTLNKAAREVNADVIAIGHNLDDIAQTVLINIMRNEPLRLVRFGETVVEDKKFVPRIRPLAHAPEREVAVYALAKGFTVDFEECPYAQKAFRMQIRNHLNDLEEKYPGTKFKIANSFATMQPLLKKGLEDTIAKNELKYCVRCKDPTTTELCMFCKMVEGIDEDARDIKKTAP